MKIGYLVLAFILSVILYFLSDYLFDVVNHKYYAEIPALKWENPSDL